MAISKSFSSKFGNSGGFFLQKSFVLYCTGLFLLLQCENMLKNNTGSRLTNDILGQGYMYIILVRQVVSLSSSDGGNVGACIV
jgi:hypothetical protein